VDRQVGQEGTEGDGKERKTGPLVPFLAGLCASDQRTPDAPKDFALWGVFGIEYFQKT
jgi:hypothetical protein